MSSDRPRDDHPDLPAEQAVIDRAYARLEEIQREALDLAEAAMAAGTKGGTFQARYERDVFTRAGLYRREQLEIGDESLCFGRLDREDGERYYVGRRGVLDADRRPLVIDWRVRAAEPFYRATGRTPMGLRLRRHLLCRGRRLLAIEDEHFQGDELGLSGMGALVAALERPRAGTMRDIVATVQAEQDQIIRSEAQGILAVQGGPGTGKTAVALHRAAYLLFTHRARLERQGVLIVGPNALFLRYIDQVLPALGETGATLATIEELVPGARVQGDDPAAVARLKGDARMARVLARAIAQRQRPLGRDLVVRYEGHDLRIRAERLAAIIRVARRNRRSHNRRRAMLHSILVKELLGSFLRAEKKLNVLLPGIIDRRIVRKELRTHEQLLAALDEMWPAIVPEQLLRELYASPEALAAAAGRILRREERALLERAKSAPLTRNDVPLMDEILVRAGVVATLGRTRRNDEEPDPVQRYGHILVDEVQDLSPMALRMVGRRSRAGWMTIVGDLAQAVGPWTPSTWDDITRHMQPRAGIELRELTINYRTPEEIMRLAERVRAAAGPGLAAPRAVRRSGVEPMFEQTGDVYAETARLVKEQQAQFPDEMILVVTPEKMLERASEHLGVPPTRAEDPAARLSGVVTLADADTVKGLEFDAVILVEPGVLVEEHPQGLRALYVCLTRATKRLVVVHSEPLPAPLERARAAWTAV